MGQSVSHLLAARILVHGLAVAFLAIAPSALAANPPVFPGAEGFGATTPAGRGGVILKVTNLNNTGAGSLRAAITATGARVVIFEVSGTIKLASYLEIRNPFITIAGQTAPSPGINLRGAGLSIQTHDVLVQHLRVRVGDDPDGVPPGNRDGVQVLGPAYNVVVDHVSVSWAIDESADCWFAPNDVTFSRCLLAEALNHSLHPEGPHSKGLLIGQASKNISIIGNLLAHHVDRGAGYIKDGAEAVVVNNLVYNWVNSARATLLGSTDSSPSPILTSVVGNVYVRGADTPATAYAVGTNSGIDPGTKLYTNDNKLEGVSAYYNTSALDPIVTTRPIWLDSLTVDPANSVEASVLAKAGARPVDRDAVDARIVNDVRNRSGRIIDSPTQVGGWPTLATNTRPLTPPANPNADADGNGYTNLEEWLHGYSRDVESGPLPSATLSVSPATITSGQSSTLTWSTTNASSVTIDQGIGSVGASGTRSVTPAATTTYTLTASNASGTTTKQTTVTVQAAANHAPVLSPIGNKSITAGQLITFTISGSDPDGQALFYNATGVPAGAVWSGVTFSWTPTTAQVGTHQVTFSVSDGSLSDSETVTITVTVPSATGITVSGTVRDPGGNPIADVAVKLNKVGTYPSGQPVEDLTDAQGRFVLTDVQTASELRNAILDCQTIGACAPISKKLTASKTDWRFSNLPSVTFDPANMQSATGQDIVGTPR